MIALARADSGAALSHLEEAMRLDPVFSPSQSPIARRVLESLRARPRLADLSPRRDPRS
jgi:hypothetical protein